MITLRNPLALLQKEIRELYAFRFNVRFGNLARGRKTFAIDSFQNFVSCEAYRLVERAYRIRHACPQVARMLVSDCARSIGNECDFCGQRLRRESKHDRAATQSCKHFSMRKVMI